MLIFTAVEDPLNVILFAYHQEKLNSCQRSMMYFPTFIRIICLFVSSVDLTLLKSRHRQDCKHWLSITCQFPMLHLVSRVESHSHNLSLSSTASSWIWAKRLYCIWEMWPEKFLCLKKTKKHSLFSSQTVVKLSTNGIIICQNYGVTSSTSFYLWKQPYSR